MRFDVKNIRKPLSINISGDEQELRPLYDLFPEGYNQSLTAKILISPTSYDYLRVEGHLTFNPKVSCNRCIKPIVWPMSESIDAIFKATPSVPVNVDQTSDEIDEDYYISEDGKLDLLQVLIDHTVGELPARLVQTKDDGKTCLNCDADLEDTLSFETKPDEDNHPFAALKKLILPN